MPKVTLWLGNTLLGLRQCCICLKNFKKIRSYNMPRFLGVPSRLCVLTHVLEICSLPGAKIQPSCTDTGILHRGFAGSI